jgi:hypothetical protein
MSACCAAHGLAAPRRPQRRANLCVARDSLAMMAVDGQVDAASRRSRGSHRRVEHRPCGAHACYRWFRAHATLQPCWCRPTSVRSCVPVHWRSGPMAAGTPPATFRPRHRLTALSLLTATVWSSRRCPLRCRSPSGHRAAPLRGAQRLRSQCWQRATRRATKDVDRGAGL